MEINAASAKDALATELAKLQEVALAGLCAVIHCAVIALSDDEVQVTFTFMAVPESGQPARNMVMSTTFEKSDVMKRGAVKVLHQALRDIMQMEADESIVVDGVRPFAMCAVTS